MIDFNKLIDNYLVREYKAKPIGRYYPSEVGGCLRKTWFSYKFPKETDVALMRIFEAGNMLHEFITDVIKSEKNKEVDLIDSEMPIKIERDGFIISGRIDNLVLLKVDGKQVLVEVKSTKYLPKEHKLENEMQLQLYMHATKVHTGIILYIQKDNLQTNWFDIDYNEKEVENILDRFEILHKSLVMDKMPWQEAKTDPDKRWMCDYCAYGKECDLEEHE